MPDKREACVVKDFVVLPKEGIDQETIRPCVRVDILKNDWHNLPLQWPLSLFHVLLSETGSFKEIQGRRS